MLNENSKNWTQQIWKLVIYFLFSNLNIDSLSLDVFLKEHQVDQFHEFWVEAKIVNSEKTLYVYVKQWAGV